MNKYNQHSVNDKVQMPEPIRNSELIAECCAKCDRTIGRSEWYYPVEEGDWCRDCHDDQYHKCPYSDCNNELSRRPKGKTRCPTCGRDIHVVNTNSKFQSGILTKEQREQINTETANHLIIPLENLTIVDCCEQLKCAGEFLRRQSNCLIEGSLRSVPSEEFLQQQNWASQIKRLEVDLDVSDRPHIVAARRENFIEVVNQCATLDRMIDCLEWVARQPRFQDCNVFRCHPTTSSAKSNGQEAGDNDLMLALAQTDQIMSRFEVSDVASEWSDGNGKERKDLKSLGVNISDFSMAYTGDLFLVVSRDFAAYIERGSPWTDGEIQRRGRTSWRRIDATGVDYKPIQEKELLQTQTRIMEVTVHKNVEEETNI